jgi:hypothetical protein
MPFQNSRDEMIQLFAPSVLALRLCEKSSFTLVAQRKTGARKDMMRFNMPVKFLVTNAKLAVSL